RTERTAAILLDQLRGALNREVREIIELISADQTADAIKRLDTLRSRSSFGQHLVRPWRVAICGPPNAGKSSLHNALLGYERSIISPLPGTTRDVLTNTVALDGWPVELADTAGLREAVDSLESAGVHQARKHFDQVDLLLLVVDASTAWQTSHLGFLSDKAEAITVFNKADLPAAISPDQQPGLRVSARTGQGIEELIREMIRLLVPDPPAPRAAVPFTTRQADLIGSAYDRALANDIPRTLSLLPRVNG
ncbi:unnamed protein product, partial [marine sediment metagenome]